jgi:hypothetical protein
VKRYAIIRTDLNNEVIGFAASIDEGHQLIDRWVKASSGRERKNFDVVDLHEEDAGRVVEYNKYGWLRYDSLERECRDPGCRKPNPHRPPCDRELYSR